MTIPPRPATQPITHHVPAHLVNAFLQMAEEFFAQARGQQTTGQRAEEIRARDRDAGLDSLAHLLDVAERDSNQSGVVARFLAGLYNGQDFPFDLTDLRRLDDDLFEHCLAVLRLDQLRVEVQAYFPDGDARWQRLIKNWGLDKRLPPEPSIAHGPHCAARYRTVAEAPGYRDVTLLLDIDDGVPRAAPVELQLSAADSATLAQTLLDLHRRAWRDPQRGPIDRQPGEMRPHWL
ncbi:hypothetical protein [Ralstonia pseudosolanacearum]|uniref:DUF7673 family protein n=1 Tax=Ralstonia pseudosolanacearum TaxID=1310165 RepID=UPI0008D9041A|nr:hypothetical protein [Ralstonia pseudosolanacearum]MCL1622605.1 hypothetical protein [Ralstonia pseudosolanacearum CaRs-Mep]